MENDPLIGKELGVYRIQSRLGEGGMALVYKAYHARLQRAVAIKVILPQIADQAGFRERFEQEGRLIAKLEHRNIVAVYDFGDLNNFTYLVMQYVGGGTLRDMLRRNGYIEIQQAVHYTIQMARALHHAHQRGIIHRDVKPQNMLISASDPNEILLSDFGIAKILDRDNSQETLLHSVPEHIHNDPSLTSADQMIGTADYMAPEQINRQAVDARTDVYALGIVFFQMLTGQVPFTSTTLHGLLFQQVYIAPRPAHELNPNVPEVLEKIIFRALEKAPDRRFPTAEAMAQALEVALSSAISPARMPQRGDYTTMSGQSSDGTLTSPSMNRSTPLQPSRYEQQGQSSAPSPYTLLPSSATNNSSDFNRFSIASPARPIGRRKFRISYVAYLIIALLALGLTFNNVVSPWLCNQEILCLGASSSTGSGGSGGSSSTLSSNTEDFHNNAHNWSLYQGGFTAQVQNNQYQITVADGNTYFPHPSLSGHLPQNFTLTAQIAEKQGSPSAFYGLAFRLQGTDTNVDSYAFAIDEKGDYALMKYTASKMSYALQGQSTFIRSLNQTNTLQATIQGNTFSFKINGQAVVTPNSTNNTYTDNDHPWSDGLLGIMVSGTNAQFIVTSVALVVQ